MQVSWYVTLMAQELCLHNLVSKCRLYFMKTQFYLRGNMEIQVFKNSLDFVPDGSLRLMRGMLEIWEIFLLYLTIIQHKFSKWTRLLPYRKEKKILFLDVLWWFMVRLRSFKWYLGLVSVTECFILHLTNIPKENRII